MSSVLVLVPILALLAGVFMYRFNGRKEFLHLDAIQFFYTFVLAPIFFVWGKSVLHLIMTAELGAQITPGMLFVIDTAFSLLFMYVYAFVVMHSLTNTINQKVSVDPLYDIFQHLEYIHLWISHLGIFIGALSIVAVVGLLNAGFPLPFEVSKAGMYATIVASFWAGMIVYLGIIPLSDPMLKGKHFSRIMKLTFGILFLAHVLAYFLLDVRFTPDKLIFWMTSFAFAGLTGVAAVVRKSRRLQASVDVVADALKRKNWEFGFRAFKFSHK